MKKKLHNTFNVVKNYFTERKKVLKYDILVQFVQIESVLGLDFS